MNPGLSEEAGKVASGIVEALKAQPAVLALTVANIGMMVFIFYALHGAANFRDQMLSQMYEERKQVNELLAKCVVPKQGELKWHGEEEKPHSNATLLKNSPGTYVAWITQAGDLEGWYCTTRLVQPFINGGTGGQRQNRE